MLICILRRKSKRHGGRGALRTIRRCPCTCYIRTSICDPLHTLAPAILLVLLTFVLDFIRQIGMVLQITAMEHLPESGENRHGALPQGGIRK